MARIIEADVIQKIATEAEWLTQTRIPYKGQIMIVSDSTGKVVNMKVGDGSNTFANLNYMFDFTNSQRISAVAPGELPTPTDANTYMVVTGIGDYTYGGSTIVSITDDGYQATLWWTGSDWVSNGVVRIKGDQIENFSPNFYVSGAQVYHNGDIWQATEDTDTIDIPGVSNRWEIKIPDVDYYPLSNQPTKGLLVYVPRLIKQLHILDYNDNYNYQIYEVRRGADVSGITGKVYVIYILVLDKTTNDVVGAYKWEQVDIDESQNYIAFDLFQLEIDWSNFPYGQSLFSTIGDSDFYISKKAGEINSIFYDNVTRSLAIYSDNNVKAGGVNLSIGRNALGAVTTGGYNVAIGDNAMGNNINGGGNVAIGPNAMMYATTPVDCTAVGYEAAKFLQRGVGDTSMGRMALRDATIATGSTAIGDSPLMMVQPDEATQNGYANTAVGYTAGERNITSKYSCFYGNAAARNLTGLMMGVVIGREVMFNSTGTVNRTIAIGYQAMLNSNASDNVAIGMLALNQNTTGENVAIGSYAGASITEGSRNIFIGYGTASSGTISTPINNTIVIGHSAMPTKSNQVIIGNNTTEEVVLAGVTFTKAQLEALKALIS